MQTCSDTTASVILARYAYAYLCIYLRLGTREMEVYHWINIRCSRPLFFPKRTWEDVHYCTTIEAETKKKADAQSSPPSLSPLSSAS